MFSAIAGRHTLLRAVSIFCSFLLSRVVSLPVIVETEAWACDLYIAQQLAFCVLDKLVVQALLKLLGNRGVDANGLEEGVHLLLILEVRVIAEALDDLQDVPPDLIARVRHVHGELLGPALESQRRLTGVLATEVRDRLNEICVIICLSWLGHSRFLSSPHDQDVFFFFSRASAFHPHPHP